MLEDLGNAIFFIMGVLAGASIMYVFELIMDWREDHEKA